MTTTYSMARNPLSSKRITGIGTWAEWQDLWNQTTHTEALVSLLHYGFDTYGLWLDKVVFYLQVANAGSVKSLKSDTCTILKTFPGGAATTLDHGIPNALTKTNHQGVKLPQFAWLSTTKVKNGASSEELRRFVAAKALEILCLQVFKQLETLRLPDEDQAILLKALLKWFAFEENRRGSGLKNGHHEKIFASFCRLFAENVWRTAQQKHVHARDLKKLSTGARAQAIKNNKERKLCRQNKATILALADSHGHLEHILLTDKSVLEKPTENFLRGRIKQQCKSCSKYRDWPDIEKLAWVHNEPYAKLLCQLQERDRLLQD